MKFTRSSLRRAMYSMIAMAGIFSLAVAGSIIISTAKGTEIDWSGISKMVIAIGVFISPVIGGKVWQKKYETLKKDKSDEESR